MQNFAPAGGRGVGGIISFRADDLSRSVQYNNAICLARHEKGDWSGSTHEVRNVACTNRHTIMRSVSQKFQLKTVYVPESCFQCHKEKPAQMARSSHTPLREGKIVCSDCHNSHGTANEVLLRTATINEHLLQVPCPEDYAVIPQKFDVHLVPRHSGSDWLIPSQARMGRSSGGTRIWMLRATPG